jgi:hypothetical protein
MLFLFLKEFANIRILSQLFNSDFKNIFEGVLGMAPGG